LENKGNNFPPSPKMALARFMQINYWVEIFLIKDSGKVRKK